MFKTIKNFSEGEFEFEHSKFIGSAMPIQTEQEAILFIEKIKSKNKKSSHNAYAFILKENNYFKFSDDKEPSGTAGMPILNFIKSNELFDVCIVVTRYFGGTLLGTGGLIHSYSTAAKIIIHNENIICKAMCDFCYIICDFKLLNRISSTIKKYGGFITNIDYSTQNENIINFTIKKIEYEFIAKQITEVSSGKVKINIVKSEYFAL